MIDDLGEKDYRKSCFKRPSSNKYGCNKFKKRKIYTFLFHKILKQFYQSDNYSINLTFLDGSFAGKIKRKSPNQNFSGTPK